jgi:uncharacterized Zn finger protein
MACKMCGGHLNKLGVLGNREHLRCRNCGAMWSRSISAKAIKKKKDKYGV